MAPLMRTPRCLSAPPGLGSNPGVNRRRSQPRAVAAPSTQRPPSPSWDPDEEVRGAGAGGSGNGGSGGGGSGGGSGGGGGGSQQVAPAAPVWMEDITVASSLQKLFILGFSLLAAGMPAFWAVLGYRLQPIEKAVGGLQAGMEKGQSELKQELREVKVGMHRVELVTAGMAGALTCAVLSYLAGR